MVVVVVRVVCLVWRSREQFMFVRMCVCVRFSIKCQIAIKTLFILFLILTDLYL